MEHKSRTLADQEWNLAISRNMERINYALEANFGLKPGVVHNYSLKKAIQAVIEKYNTSLQKAIELICRIPLENDVVQAIILHITVYETYFFRHPEHFAWMREFFLSSLEKRKREEGSQFVRCWSAGCSTGEEPYSIAITLYEYFRNKEGWDLQIEATDINPESLEFARRGCYWEWSFRGVPQEIRTQYFSDCSQEHEHIPGMPRLKRYQLDEKIRVMVHFSELNLSKSQWESPALSRGRFDLIFCRNVLIYFPQHISQALVGRLSQYLDPEGAFIVGPSESWLLNNSAFAALPINNGTVFMLSKAGKAPEPKSAQDVAAMLLLLHKPHKLHKAPGARMQKILSTLPGITSAPGKAMPANADQPANFISNRIPAKLLNKEPVAQQPSREEIAAEARALADSGKYEEAITRLTDLISKDSTVAELYYLRALANLNRRKFGEAAEDLKKELFLEPDNVLAYIALASIAKENGNNSEMKKQYSNALHFLSKMKETDIVPDSGEMPAGVMRDIVASLMR